MNLRGYYCELFENSVLCIILYFFALYAESVWIEESIGYSLFTFSCKVVGNKRKVVRLLG